MLDPVVRDRLRGQRERPIAAPARSPTWWTSFHEGRPLLGLGAGKRRWIYYSLTNPRYIW